MSAMRMHPQFPIGPRHDGDIEFSFTGRPSRGVVEEIDNCQLALTSLACMICELDQLDQVHLRGISRILEGVASTLQCVNDAIERAGKKGGRS